MDLRYFAESGEGIPQRLCLYFGAQVSDENVVVLWKENYINY
jgi:hypothetical protein